MKLEEIIKSGIKSKKELLQKVLDLNTERYDFVIKYYKLKPRFLRYLKKISTKVYKYKHIPYIGFSTEKNVAKELINYYLEGKNNTLSKDLKKLVQIKMIDVVSDVKAIPATDEFTAAETLGQNWNLAMIGTYYAQNITKGKNIKVGVIDTGVDYNHKELKQLFKSEKGYDFVLEKPDGFDYNGHGTHVAGIIGGKTTGIAPEITMYSLRVLDETGSGYEFDVIRAIEWAIDKNIDVVNMSLGSPYASSALEEICKYASNKLMLVAAAGNDGANIPNYPAALDGVISVAAIDENKQHAYFSNIHETVDISAPGVDVYSTFPYNEYRYLSGTSMATPHITGVLALAKSIASTTLYEDVMKITAEKLDYEGPYDPQWVFGAGLVRVDKMLDYLMKKESQKRKRKKLFMF